MGDDEKNGSGAHHKVEDPTPEQLWPNYHFWSAWQPIFDNSKIGAKHTKSFFLSFLNQEKSKIQENKENTLIVQEKKVRFKKKR